MMIPGGVSIPCGVVMPNGVAMPGEAPVSGGLGMLSWVPMPSETLMATAL